MSINGMLMWKKYRQAKFESVALGLRYEDQATAVKYFCTPKHAKIFASMGMGGIHYCTIPGLGDSIFVVTPEPCGEHYVFPVARDLRGFLQLVAALDGTQLIDQIPLFGKEDFESALSEHKRICGDDAATDRERLEKTFELEPLARSPYDTVMELYRAFDYSRIQYTAEYYDTLGLDR